MKMKLTTIGIKTIDFIDLICFPIQFNAHLLYFDKLIYDKKRLTSEIEMCQRVLAGEGDKGIRNKQKDYLASNQKTIELLENNGYLQGIDYSLYNKQGIEAEIIEAFQDDYLMRNLSFRMMWQADGKTFAPKDLAALTNDYKFLHFYYDRKLAEFQNLNSDEYYIPISSEIAKRDVGAFFQDFRLNTETINSDIISFVINEFPVIELNKVGIDRILELRQNNDLMQRQLALRRWINKLIKGKATMFEAKEEFETLSKSYEEHLKLLRVKYSRSKFEVITTAVAELIEDLAKLKLSKLVEKGFSINRGKMDLLIAETRAPGREVSYVDKLKAEMSYIR